MTTSHSDLAAPRNDLDLFLGTKAWAEVDSDREGLRCAKQETATTLLAYFDAGGSLKAMATQVGTEWIELQAAVVLTLAETMRRHAAPTPGAPKSFTRRR